GEGCPFHRPPAPESDADSARYDYYYFFPLPAARRLRNILEPAALSPCRNSTIIPSLTLHKPSKWAAPTEKVRRHLVDADIALSFSSKTPRNVTNLLTSRFSPFRRQGQAVEAGQEADQATRRGRQGLPREEARW